MTRILVTGANGFIGSKLVPALITAGFEVRCALTRKVDTLPGEQVLIAKLEEQRDWSAILKEVDVVIHLAARVHVMQEYSESALDDYSKVNNLGTQNLAKQAAQYKIKRFIFLSSIKVNGESTLIGIPFTENSPTQPEDPYGLSKLAAEQSLLAMAQKSDMQVVILRSPLVYGAGVKANFLKMLQWVDKGLPLPFATVQNKRSFVYIDNLISALGAVIQDSKAANQIYLIADDHSLSLTQLLSMISEEMGAKLRLFSMPTSWMVGILKLFKMKRLSTRLLGSLEVSNNKIKSQLGWNPPVSVREGLARTVKWYKHESNS